MKAEMLKKAKTLTVYHGSSEKFAAFQSGRTLHFTDSYAVAKSYAIGYYGTGTGYVYTVQLEMDNPIDIRKPGESERILEETGEWIDADAILDPEALAELDLGMEYDGIIAYSEVGGGMRDGSTEYIVWDAGQADITKVDVIHPSKIASVTDSPAFKAWFSGSKVVDEAGNPQMVFHGTLDDFDEFRNGDIGFHVGTNEQAEKRISIRQNSRQLEDLNAHGWGHIMPLYACIKNPLVMQDIKDWNEPWDVQDFADEATGGKLAHLFEPINSALWETPDVAEATPDEPDRAGVKKALGVIRDALMQLGYDGIQYENEYEGAGTSWICFKPNQVKSAIGNDGSFDANSNSITASTIGPVLKATPEDISTAIEWTGLAGRMAEAIADNDNIGHDFAVHSGDLCVGLMKMDTMRAMFPEEYPEASIDYLAVDPDFQRQGVGKKMVQYAIDIAREAGVGLRTKAEVAMGPDTPSDYWKSLGFVDKGRRNFELPKSKAKTAATIGPVYHGTTYDFDTFKKNKGLRSGFLGSVMEVDVLAFFFTEDKRQALAYAKNRKLHTKQPTRVITAYLTINHLLDLTDPNWVNTPITTPPLPLHKSEEKHTEYIYEDYADELETTEGLLDYIVNYILADDMSKEEWYDIGIDPCAGPDCKPTLDEGFQAWELFDNKKVSDALRYLGYDGFKIPEGEDAEFGGTSWAVFSATQVRIVSNKEAGVSTSGLIGNCINSFDEDGDCILPQLPWGTVSDFASSVEELGNAFVLDGVRVEYDEDSDTHYFYDDNVEIDKTGSDVDLKIAARTVPADELQTPNITPEMTPEIKEWFKGSVVVNDDDTPRVVYHGSRVPWLIQFDLSKEGSGLVSRSKNGAIWFTSNRDNASWYADYADKLEASTIDPQIYGDEGNFYAVVTPVDYEEDASPDLFTVGPFATEAEAEQEAIKEAKRYNELLHEDTFVHAAYLRITNPLIVDKVPRYEEFEAAKAGGHDGIIAIDVVDGVEPSDIYVVFAPRQIRSADARRQYRHAGKTAAVSEEFRIAGLLLPNYWK